MMLYTLPRAARATPDVYRTLRLADFRGAALLMDNEQVLVARGYGRADDGSPYTTRTAFNLDFLARPLAATLVMQLVERGWVSLHDPVSAYLPEHRETMLAVGDLLRGVGNGLLSSVVERALGKRYADALYERVLLPAGMRGAAFDGATLYGTLRDVFRWQRALFGGRLVRHGTLARMRGGAGLDTYLLSGREAVGVMGSRGAALRLLDGDGALILLGEVADGALPGLVASLFV
jgi:CubicO group peptidase (beta-lactamase class C family)